MSAAHLHLPLYSMGALPQTAAASNGDGKPRPHVLVVPYPAQGHLLPLLDLVVLLARRGLAVTVAVTPGNVRFLAALPSSVATVVLPFPSTPLLPAGCGENTNHLPADLFRPLMASLVALSAPLLSWCKAQPHAVTAIIADLFMGWTLPLAQELGVPHVAFLPASVHYLATTRSLWRRMPTGHDGDERVVHFPELPGSPAFPWHRLSWLYRMHVAGDEVSETIRQILLWSLESSCFVVNSFAALEPSCFEDAMAAKRVFMVGPLSEAAAVRGSKEPTEVTAWLDAFDDGSVVYISFRSQEVLSPAQAASVADALRLSSTAAFVWVVRSNTVVPEGFEAATASRGTVIRGWAPQLDILRHRAVGWSLTQCGGSSVMEMAAAGVAMLTWPMSADQFTNAWLLEEAGVAVPVAEGADAVPDAGKVANAISTAVASEEGESIRRRAAELGRKAAAAVAAGGTSYNDLEELVHGVLSDVHVLAS
ncbi:UDP-glycosyltransferase 89B1-like [Hordeum vulgare]|nr:UDP-glycosyltransferase 89B1-like [Hordeum vulgare]